MDGSNPFSYSAEELVTLGKHLGIAFLGFLSAFGTAELLPSLKGHASNDLGILIVTLLAAGGPVLIHAGVKFFSDTRK